jgi:uncharacterized protein YjbI with pentapeptide repeats
MVRKSILMRRAVGVLPVFAAGLAILGVLVPVAALRADIYQWKWAGQVKVASSALCPGGVGVSAVPSADLSNRNLSRAYLENTDLSAANLSSSYLLQATLAGANLSYVDLTAADLRWSDLRGANLSNATIERTRFFESNLSADQLYSTTNYKLGNLAGTSFPTSLVGWNFAGKNLTDASFQSADVTGANFSGAIIVDSAFDYSTLTATQLYSTASYQSHDLRGLYLRSHDLRGWNLAGQNLSQSLLQGGKLTGVDLRNANLTYAGLYDLTMTGANLTGANLTGTDFSRSDMRGVVGAVLSSATTEATILPDGTIHGNNWGDLGVTFRNSPEAIPVRIVEKWSPSSWLVFSLDDQPWQSTISFEPGIPVTLTGELMLSLADGLGPESLTDRTIKLFDWSGVTPNGTFSSITDRTFGTLLYKLDASRLYSTGEVRFVSLVPEPSSVGLLAACALCLLAYGRSRRRQARRTWPAPSSRAV